MMAGYLLRAIVCVVLLALAHGFANYLTHHYCDAPIQNSEMMMGQNLMLSYAKNMTLFRDGKPLTSNVVRTFDGVSISLVPKSVQSVLEIRTPGVEFKGGSCSRKHRIIRTGEFVLPNADTLTYPLHIHVVGAWAMSYEKGVKYTEPFTIIYDPNAEVQTSNGDEL